MKLMDEASEASDIREKVTLLLIEQLERADETTHDWKVLLEAEHEDYLHAVERERSEESSLRSVEHELRALKEAIDVDENARLRRTLDNRIAQIHQKIAHLPRDLHWDRDSRSRELETDVSTVVGGAHEAAARAYGKLIQQEPHQYSLYLGRARAYWRTGKKELARADLKRARALAPDNPQVAKVEASLESGNPESRELRGYYGAMLLRYRGNSALRKGDTDAAYTYYERAEEVHPHPAYWPLNEAMVAIAENDGQLAREAIEDIEVDSMGQHMYIQTRLVLCLASALGENEGEWEDAKSGLIEAVRACSDFRLSKGPLRHLRTYLDRSDRLRGRISDTFALIPSPEEGH